jgi:pimeloyl-ACP methyl ester carboxylesterase
VKASELPSTNDWRRWGIDPSWHRVVRVAVNGSPDIEWSIIETGSGSRGTIVCVHGNPTWSYLWKDVLRQLGGEWRVIAIDQTGMGWSERSAPRKLEDRVAELVAFCQQHTSGPLVLMAHDWGGPVALGASAFLDVQAVILGNTGVALPEGVPMPPLIATARRFVDISCRRSPLFVAGTSRMTATEHRQALNAPYRTSSRRAAVAEFVADIPLDEGDISWSALRDAAASLEQLDVPLLLVWGGADPVFNDRFLADSTNCKSVYFFVIFDI